MRQRTRHRRSGPRVRDLCEMGTLSHLLFVPGWCPHPPPLSPGPPVAGAGHCHSCRGWRRGSPWPLLWQEGSEGRCSGLRSALPATAGSGGQFSGRQEPPPTAAGTSQRWQGGSVTSAQVETTQPLVQRFAGLTGIWMCAQWTDVPPLGGKGWGKVALFFWGTPLQCLITRKPSQKVVWGCWAGCLPHHRPHVHQASRTPVGLSTGDSPMFATTIPPPAPD